MDVQIKNNPDYGELLVQLEGGETITIEAGAMSRMSTGLDMRARMLGGFLAALARKLFGGESFFVGEYGGPQGGHIALSPSMPGSVRHRSVDGGEFYLTAGSFLACSPGVILRTRFGGLRALFSGEGAFLIVASGSGDLWFNAYGAVVEREVLGELVVDTGHVVGWEAGLEYSIGGMGGLKSTLLSGEGLTMKFRGTGTIWLQTRNLPATAGWLSPFCSA